MRIPEPANLPTGCDALARFGAISRRQICDTSHIVRISLPFARFGKHSAVCFCIFMGCMRVASCMVVSPARLRSGAPGSTVRVEVLRLPPSTLFALEDNQSSASARSLEPTVLGETFPLLR